MSGAHAEDRPRVLVLAADEIVTDFSTGITVANLFADWPEQRVAQVYLVPSTGQGERLTGRSVGMAAHGGVLDVPVRWGLRVLRRVARIVRSAVRRGRPRATPAAQQTSPSSHNAHPHPELAAVLEMGPVRVSRRVAEFVRETNPDVIYSPLSGIRMMKLAGRLSRLTGAPVVPHLLDDWPETLYANGELGGRARATTRRLLHETLRGAPAVGVISQAMADEYRERYGITATPLMNCVDTLGSPKAAGSAPAVVRFAYIGGLHLGRAPLLREIARAVEDVDGAELVIHAPDDDLALHRALFADISHLRYGPSLAAHDVPAALEAADVLVHIESFDEETSRYTRLSISTKIPQYLAAARPVLAVGPAHLASIRHLVESGAAVVVGEVPGTLGEDVRRLSADAGLRHRLATAGVRFAEQRHHSSVVREDLRRLLEVARR